MGDKIRFKVYDKNGNDVTNTKDWFIDNYGLLQYMTHNIDSITAEADEGYYYKITEYNRK